MEELVNEKQALKKLKKKLTSATSRAMMDFSMLEEGDKLMVCLSGGKDSYALLDMVLHTQRVVPFHFDVVAVNLDQKQPGFPEHILPEYLKNLGVDFEIVEKDTYSVVKEKVPEGKTTCSLCSRLRRGNLYETAKRLGANKLALGHHQDDIIETFFLNLFFSGKLEAMPAKYLTDDGSLTVLRPMAYCREQDIADYAALRAFPIIPCNLCGSQPKLQRQVVKGMLKTWEQAYPDRMEIIMNALQNVSPSHLLDHQLFDFMNMHGRDLSALR
ncbi:tRNA 2-thiocytidine(32) synthetase TtcA [Persicobacter psychrovividus]|uniref:tRNA-cytidine(32) 2-sulfurtransferase n=1 Tax=Persicobacter psychrovividus TaxID=387638 RepID=A0ABM7VJD1_9BACT|nr:tRNA 2-thiocytidine biosynthesis protein TtcA [Persicobacter psychrovividus]